MAGGFDRWLSGLLRLSAEPQVTARPGIDISQRLSLVVYDFNGRGRRLAGATRLRWSNHYGSEGSGFGYLTFTLDRRVGYDYRDVQFGYRAKLFKGPFKILFDGQIRKITESHPDKLEITVLGWNVLFGDDTFNWVFCDTRYTLWRSSEEATGSFQPDKFDYDLQERIRITPRNGVDFEAQQFTFLRYIFQFGEVASRITADYDLSMPSVWTDLGGELRLVVRDSTGAILWAKWVDGAGSLDVTTSGSPTYFEVRLNYVNAGEHARDEGDVYGELTNVKVYGVTDTTLDGGVIAKKVLSETLTESYHDLSADESQIASPGQVLEPSAFDTDVTPEQVMNWVCRFGDSDGNPLAWGVEMSDEQRMFLETMDLTTIQYVVKRASSLQAQVTGDWQDSWQKVYGIYTDTEGATQRTDDRTDDDAMTTLGGYARRRGLQVDGATDETTVLEAVDLYLDESKLPKVSSSFTVRGHIYSPTGNKVAFDEIQAGGMVQVRDFRAREASLTPNDFRDRWTTFQLVGVEIDQDGHSARLIPAGDRSSFEQYMALLSQLKG